MTEQKRNQIFELLLNEIGEAKLEARILNSEEGSLLRAIVPMGNDEIIRAALADIAIVTTARGTEIAQIFFTLTAELAENAAEEIRKAVPSLNFYSLIGSYGVYDNSQVYFKYSIALSEIDDSELRAGEILDALAASFESLNTVYDAVMTIAEGAMDYETAVQKELVPKM